MHRTAAPPRRTAITGWLLVACVAALASCAAQRPVPVSGQPQSRVTETKVTATQAPPEPAAASPVTSSATPKAPALATPDAAQPAAVPAATTIAASGAEAGAAARTEAELPRKPPPKPPVPLATGVPPGASTAAAPAAAPAASVPAASVPAHPPLVAPIAAAAAAQAGAAAAAQALAAQGSHSTAVALPKAAAPLVLSAARTPRDYRLDGARHIYRRLPERIFAGKLPRLLLAVGVINIEIDARGEVTGIQWARAPRSSPRVIGEIEQLVRAAAPYPAPVHMGGVTYTDTWLWDKSGRFQLDTLTQGQD